MIRPHGGELINRFAAEERRPALLEQARKLEAVQLDGKNISDLEMIASGAMSPLRGFMTRQDYGQVVEDMHLENGLVWSLPITLAIDKATYDRIKNQAQVALVDQGGIPLALMDVEDIFTYDKEREAEKVFRTKDPAHPGVAYVLKQGEFLLGGAITMLNRPTYNRFNEYRRDPAETRRYFAEKGWNTVVAFQTRNPIHRAHEYLQKCALEVVDGLLIHPLMGQTKSDDIPADVRMRCYEVLLEKYYPKDRVLLSIFPAAMRYAGPREAIFHALVRKNYGCTHIIIGRDHAGVGNYYGTYDAQYIFQEFRSEELEIIPLFFEHAFYCTECGNMASSKTCPHGKEAHVFLSGTKVREMLARGESPPPEFTRPEVAEVLVQWATSKNKN